MHGRARIVPGELETSPFFNPYHVTQRGNYRQIVFESDADYRRYLACLKECSKNGRCH